MENKTREQDDQASELRKLIDEVESTQDEANQEEKRPQIQHSDAGTDVKTERNIDILNLPPVKKFTVKRKNVQN
ncbi:hypothetical protein [Lentibacillus amyloliquefaciens]|uniref:Uncharacterized protein n=1 Tax=Lentibacillus amyloliquefaciens TaxID=1472767 RepID=A0A0U4G5N2_9BACI|nr:hypothetical protein [Lentibacillus amyloliquefaciens]ALX47978.1 hypothetical protein AOX59_04775 [Lentibacillus amyloliquefaciens]